MVSSQSDKYIYMPSQAAGINERYITIIMHDTGCTGSTDVSIN